MTKRRKPSNPRLEAEGWDDKEATEVIDLALERVKRGAVEGCEKLRHSMESLSQTSEEVRVDLGAIKAYVESEPPPPPEDEAAAASR
jgi:hypothetical protein